MKRDTQARPSQYVDRVVTFEPLQRKVAARAAVLMAIGMFTGIWSGLALAGKVKVDIPHLALAAHLNALFGCFWLIAIAFTLPMLSFDAKQKERLTTAALLPTYGNWLITLIASFVGERGLEFTGKVGNDVIAALLILVVVLPALAVSTLWALGFRKPAAAS